MIDTNQPDYFLAKATIKQKARAFDLLLKYHHQCSTDDTNSLHSDQVCRMTTYLRAVMEHHWMLDGDDLVMYYDIWEGDE